MSKVFLKKGRDASLKRFHPWVFSGAVSGVEGELFEGELVSVFSFDNEFLGCGHFQKGSITVRILAFDDSPYKQGFWNDRLEEAYKTREQLCIMEEGKTNSFRLVHGEGDMLPGLVLDYYNGVVVMQAHSAGMVKSKEQIVDALKYVLKDKLLAVYDKSSSTAPFKAGLDLQDGFLYQEKGVLQSGAILENGLAFNVDWLEGQKTGFFLDQRENRELVRRYAKGKGVLNLFCYTGGFSVYALSGGASFVDSVDSSARAIEMTTKNLKLNMKEGAYVSHNEYCADAIDFLKNSQDNKYDMIIVDPPAFAKHRDALRNALRAYQRLNANAISKVSKGGIIFTFSCSQVVDKVSFAEAVFSAAAISGRRVRIIGRMTQPADHPVNIYHPEGEYLKGLVLRVD
jgi:23S rRNA (cytosine1962-C5)-methyltransferase